MELYSDQAGIDVFVTSLTGDGTALNYSTYFGGSGLDVGWDIAVTDGGLASIVGYTLSTDLPTVLPVQDTSGGSWDAFLTTFASGGGVHSPFQPIWVAVTPILLRRWCWMPAIEHW